MKGNVRSFLLTLQLVTALLGIGLVQSSPAMANGANSFTLNQRTPFDDTFWVPCAGEYVHLTGELRDVLHVTETPGGGFHVVIVYSAMGMSGIGLTSGDTYRGVGVSRFNANLQPGVTVSGTDNSLLIGPGPGNNLYMRSRFHVTRNANDELVFVRDVEEVTCN